MYKCGNKLRFISLSHKIYTLRLILEQVSLRGDCIDFKILFDFLCGLYNALKSSDKILPLPLY